LAVKQELMSMKQSITAILQSLLAEMESKDIHASCVLKAILKSRPKQFVSFSPETKQANVILILCQYPI